MSFDLFGALSPTSSQCPPETGTQSGGGRAVSQVEVEGSTPQYEGTFEDYLEMFIQFGYVILFSSAYPLAGLCALINNIIEIRGDAFKLCHVHQRPFGQRVNNIGSWQVKKDCKIHMFQSSFKDKLILYRYISKIF